MLPENALLRITGALGDTTTVVFPAPAGTDTGANWVAGAIPVAATASGTHHTALIVLPTPTITGG